MLLSERDELIRKIAKGKEIDERDAELLQKIADNTESTMTHLLRELAKEVEGAHTALEEYTGADIDDIQILVKDPISFDARIIELRDSSQNFQITATRKMLVNAIGKTLKSAQVSMFIVRANVLLLNALIEYQQKQIIRLSTRAIEVEKENEKIKGILHARQRRKPRESGERTEERSTEKSNTN